MVFESIYRVTDVLLSPLFHLTSNQEFNILFGVFLVATIVSAIITFVTAKVVDQKEMKRYKELLKKYQDKMVKAQKKGDMKTTKKAQSKLMGVQSEMMKNSFAPMLYTMPPIILIFSWLRQYEYLQSYIAVQGYAVLLPFTLPKFGASLGWLGWYILCSFATSITIKKVFGIEGP